MLHLVMDVSIHAPARGATPFPGDAQIIAMMFQSTHPRGVRRRRLTFADVEAPGFNPRTREGCD